MTDVFTDRHVQKVFHLGVQQTSTDSHCLRDVGHSELVVADILVNQLVDLQDKLFVDVIE